MKIVWIRINFIDFFINRQATTKRREREGDEGAYTQAIFQVEALSNHLIRHLESFVWRSRADLPPTEEAAVEGEGLGGFLNVMGGLSKSTTRVKIKLVARKKKGYYFSEEFELMELSN